MKFPFNRPYTRSPKKRSIASWLVAILIIVGLVIMAIHIKKVRTLFRNVEPIMEDMYQTGASLTRRSDQLMEIQNKLAIGKSIEEDLCMLEVDEGTDKIRVAAAYNCLMRIYGKSKHSEIEIYKAIEMGSYALDLNYHSDYINNLYKVITGNSNLKLDWQDKDGEIEYLNNLASGTHDAAVSARALNRLSMIYKLGRNSSLTSRAIPDIKAAASARAKMMEFFQAYPKDRKVDIAIIVNDKYALHAGVTIASALLNAAPDSFYTFYFVENPSDPIASETKNKLQELSKLNENSKIVFKPFPNEYIEEKLFKKHPKAFKIFPHLVAYRLFLDQLFPELKNIIYLDGDIIVRRDLNRLKESTSDLYSVGAVADPEFIKNAALRKCKEMMIKTYVNSGVMVLNLDKMRKENSAEETLEAVGKYKCQLHFFDQDTVNYVYENKIKLLSTRWNMPVAAHLKSQGARNSFADFITHFIEARPGIKSSKPWLYPMGEQIWKDKPEEMLPEFQDYWAYRDVTPWKVK